MKCPHCGDTTGCEYSVRMNGWAFVCADWSTSDMSYGNSPFRCSKAPWAKCSNCGKKVPVPGERGPGFVPAEGEEGSK